MEVVLLLASLDDSVGELKSSLSSLSPVVGRDGLVGSSSESVLLNESELGGGVVAGKNASKKRKVSPRSRDEEEVEKAGKLT